MYIIQIQAVQFHNIAEAMAYILVTLLGMILAFVIFVLIVTVVERFI